VVAVVTTVSVEVCDAPNTTDVGLNEHVGVDVRFAGATLQVSPTVPVNPFVGATVITEVAKLPATTVGLVAGVSVKLGTTGAVTVTVTGVVTTVVPLVPVTVTVYALAAVVAVVATVSVEVCATPRTMEAGLNEQVGVEARFDGATLQVSATVPVNPATGVTVITDVPEFPAITDGFVAAASVNVIPPVVVTVTAGEILDAP